MCTIYSEDFLHGVPTLKTLNITLHTSDSKVLKILFFYLEFCSKFKTKWYKNNFKNAKMMKFVKLF